MGMLRTLSTLALCMVLAFVLAACGGSENESVITGTLTPLYNSSGANWNDYVKGDITNATDVSCDAGNDTACVNGGELRAVKVPWKSSCNGLTAKDALGAFNWVCDDSTNPVRMVSTGLNAGKGLANLIDFDALAWKPDSVTVKDRGKRYLKTPSTTWWSNPIEPAPDGGSLNSMGTIYVVNGTADLSADFTINASKVGLVAGPGAIINSSSQGSNSDVISADGSSTARDFLWIEGKVDATGKSAGVALETVRFSVLRNVEASNTGNGLAFGVLLSSSSHNTLSNVTASNNGIGIYLDSSSYNTFSGVNASNNLGGFYFYFSSNNVFSNITASNNNGYGFYIYTNADYNVFSDVTASNNGGTGILSGDYSYGNTFSNVTASNNGGPGISLDSSSYYTLSNVTASDNSGTGIEIGNSAFVTLSNITASNNGADGLSFFYFLASTLSNITASNNGTDGVWLQYSSSSNVFSGVTASNNASNGICFSSPTSDNVLSDVTASNNNYGVNLYSSSGNTLSAITASNNHTYGVWLDNGSSGNVLSDVTASNNGSTGIEIDSSENNKFTGVLEVGSNALYDCSVTNSPGVPDPMDPGLVNTTCTTDGSYGSSDYGIGNTSDAALYNGVDLSSSFVGRTYIDAANANTTGSAIDYSTIDPATFDWSNFENHYRVWGPDYAFGTSSSQGRWTSGNGAIWDWSVSASDAGEYDGSPALLGILNTPTGEDTITHMWSNATTTTFLKNAVEVSGDGIGNDNLLCESGETCLYTPNIGSYQGHGKLVSAGIFSDGTLTDITLLKYETNGR